MSKGIFIYFIINLVLMNIEASAQSPHLYFFTIGNAHYKVPSTLYDRTKEYQNAPQCIRSSERVKMLLNKYGEGKSFTSSTENFFSKKVILQEIESFFKTIPYDSLAIIILYYSGHGKCDNLGNLYWVPGEIDILKQRNQKNVMEDFISVVEIQNLFIENNLLRDGNNVEIYGKVTQASLFNTISTFIEKPIDNSIDSISNTLQFQSLINRTPKLIILSDCCYEKIFVDNDTSFRNYEGSVADYFTAQASGDNERDNIEENEMPEYVVYSMRNSVRKFFDIFGNRVIYSAIINNVTELATDPYDKSESILISPISRRLSLFFQKSPQYFSANELMSQLLSIDFDNKTPRTIMETTDEGADFKMKQTRLKKNISTYDYKIHAKKL
jgi:hypothetical protein